MTYDPDFSITVRDVPPDVVELAVAGELDELTVAQLQQALDAAIAVGRPVAVSLAEVTFINSAGLRTLLETDRALSAAGQRLAVTDRSPVVRRLFQITDLSDHFADRPTPTATTTSLDPAGQRLQRVITELAAVLLTATSLRENLTRLIRFSCDVLPGCDAASVALLIDGAPTTVAVNDHVALEIDLAQYDSAQGPCLTALDGESIRVEVLDTDERFSHFARRATDKDIHSVLSTPIIHRGDTIGTLNFYSHQPDAFDADAEHVARLSSAQAAHAITRAEVLTAAHQRRAQLQAHYDETAVVARAQGVLIAAQHCSAEQARNLLQHAADTTGDTLLTIAQRILDTARTSR